MVYHFKIQCHLAFSKTIVKTKEIRNIINNKTTRRFNFSNINISKDFKFC